MAAFIFGDLDNMDGSHYSLYGDGGNGEQHGLAFTLPVDGTITSVTTDWWKSGSPTDGLVTRISTSLDGSILGTSAVVPASSVPAAPYARLDFDFAPGVDVVGGVEYFLEWERTGVRSTSNYPIQVFTYTWPDPVPFVAWIRNVGVWSEPDPAWEGVRGYLEYVPALTLRNPQVTKQYDDKVRTKENKTDVVAKEYDPEHTTKKPSMNVTATVEGSR